MILYIETSDKICSVSLAENEKLTEELEERGDRLHSSALSVLINEIITKHDIVYHELDAVAVSKGPGSYTGLRIGVSVAKGICYGAGIPLVGIPTLQAMASGFLKSDAIIPDENAIYCPMLDARRMEVYCAFFNAGGNYIEKEKAVVIDEYSFMDFMPGKKIIYFGPGAEKCQPVIKRENVEFHADFFPLSSHMVSIAEYHYQKGDVEDVAYFEPFYLKDFIATTPKRRF